MRWLLGFFLILALLLVGGFIFIKGYPYRVYSHWVQGKDFNKYYNIPQMRPLLLSPVPVTEIPTYQEDYEQLWKEFPIRNTVMPLPTRHPLFQTVPIVDLIKKTDTPQIGMTLLTSTGRVLCRIYTLPTSLQEDYTTGQGLFKLPYVSNKLLKKNIDEVWKDIFSHVIEVKSKSSDEMIHDLYILHLRSIILPKATLKYGLIQGGTQALIELENKDKDYMAELVLTQKGGSIYSYILLTEKRSTESQKLRSKFLESISFTPEDSSMGRFLYTEFKQLNFARQVDQEGMLYLFSAWSQDIDNTELLKEMIFYLERGRTNIKHLKGLYQYALKKYGKTFTTSKIFSDSDDADMVLQRNIEIENLEKTQNAARDKATTPAVEMSADDKMNEYLKKAKEDGPAESEDMTVH